jgi:YVTN family beta-propeller protein
MTVNVINVYDSPHGGFVTPDGHYLYLTVQTGNYLNKIDITDPFFDQQKIALIPGQQPNTSSAQNPHEIMLTPDGSKYYVSCQGTNEVRIFQTSNDSLLTVIQVGTKPQEFDFSITHPYVFVTCTEQSVGTNKKGLVYVIDYNTNTIITSIYTGYQPHGISVDDEENLAYVANLNYDPNGPAPHHVSECGNRNGYLTIIDLNTLQLYQKLQSDGFNYQYKNELLAFPYFVAIRK